jgi:hypothetical protein
MNFRDSVGTSGRRLPPTAHVDPRGEKTPPPTEHNHGARPRGLVATPPPPPHPGISSQPFPFGKNPAKAVPLSERGGGRSPQGSHWHQALLYDRRYVRPGQLYLRRFRRICTVIVALRRVKCPQARDGRGTSSMKTKSAFTTHKPHMSHEVPPVAASTGDANPGAPGGLRAPGAGPTLGWSLRRYVPGSSLRVWLNRRTAAGSRVSTDRAGPANRKQTKGNILPMTGKGSDSCQALRNFRSRTTGQGARPALGYVE